jgi:hypothetical protein
MGLAGRILSQDRLSNEGDRLSKQSEGLTKVWPSSTGSLPSTPPESVLCRMRPVASAVIANSRLTFVLDAVLQSFRPKAAPLLPRICRVELDDTRGGRHNDGDATGAMDLTTLWTTSSCRGKCNQASNNLTNLRTPQKANAKSWGPVCTHRKPQPKWPPPTR